MGSSSDLPLEGCDIFILLKWFFPKWFHCIGNLSNGIPYLVSIRIQNPREDGVKMSRNRFTTAPVSCAANSYVTKSSLVSAITLRVVTGINGLTIHSAVGPMTIQTSIPHKPRKWGEVYTSVITEWPPSGFHKLLTGEGIKRATR